MLSFKWNYFKSDNSLIAQLKIYICIDIVFTDVQQSVVKAVDNSSRFHPSSSRLLPNNTWLACAAVENFVIDRVVQSKFRGHVNVQYLRDIATVRR